MQELKPLPCPFCAETQIKLIKWPRGGNIWEVFCLNCKATTGAKFLKKEALLAWNQRATDKTIEALVSGLRWYSKVFEFPPAMALQERGYLAKSILKDLEIDTASKLSTNAQKEMLIGTLTLIWQAAQAGVKGYPADKDNCFGHIIKTAESSLAEVGVIFKAEAALASVEGV